MEATDLQKKVTYDLCSLLWSTKVLEICLSCISFSEYIVLLLGSFIQKANRPIATLS